jgi:hypothetical protein
MRIWYLKFGRLGLTMATVALASLVAAASVPVTLDHGSMWIVNVNGSVFSAQLQRDESHEASPSVIEGKFFSRLQGGRVWKGDLKVSLGEMGGSARLALQDSGGDNFECNGTLARDGSFLAGTCDRAVPFIMVPTTAMQRAERVKSLSVEVEYLSNEVERCQAQLQSQHAEHIRYKAGEIGRCRAYFPTQQCSSEDQADRQTTISLVGQKDAKRIAESAISTIPRHIEGVNCEECDSAVILDVPLDPPGNSDQGRWLAKLLKTQDDAIFALYDTTAINLLRSTESDVCRRSQTCSALFWQHSISKGIDLLGDRQ